MKSRIVTLLIAVCALWQTSFAESGNTTFGVDAGYTSYNTSATMGLYIQHRIKNSVRLAPSVGCVFRHHDYDAFMVDLDVQYPLDLGTEKVAIYPFAGVNYSLWSLHHLKDEDDHDFTQRSGKFGLNLGAGFEYYVKETIKLKAELKYTLTSKYSTMGILVGVGYVF